MNQFVIFDAKSPLGDDISKFFNYLRDQASNLKKYAKHSDVKKELFLVIPSNTSHSVKEFRIDCGDYVVFIVSRDALEPIILSLKKIEEYENKSLEKIFELKGELYFRQVERKILLKLINSSIPKIVSLGGGTPCYFSMEY